MKTTTYLGEITPFGAISLRDARPFNAGEGGSARKLPFFPPPPASIYHALRDVVHPEDRASRQSRERSERLNKNRPKDRIRQFDLRLRGLWLRRTVDYKDEDLFPAPADARKTGEAGEEQLRVLTPQPDTRGAGSNVDGLLRPGLSTSEEVSEIQESYLTFSDLVKHAKGELRQTPSTIVRQEDLLGSDTRIGIQLDGRKAAHGRLYQQQLAVLKESVRFVVMADVDSETASAPDREAAVRLGGESRMAHVRLTTGISRDFGETRGEVREAIANAFDGVLRVKLTTLTSSMFSTDVKLLHSWDNTPAWRPALRARQWRIDGVTAPVSLIGAIVPRALPVGGWDHSHDPDRDAGPGLARPLYRCVPAGAVYFLEIGVKESEVDAVLERIFDQYWFGSILRRKDGLLTYHGKLGFGIAMPGLWTPARNRDGDE